MLIITVNFHNKGLTDLTYLPPQPASICLKHRHYTALPNVKVYVLGYMYTFDGYF